MEEMNFIENIKYLRNYANRHRIVFVMDGVGFRFPLDELWIGFQKVINSSEFILINPHNHELINGIPVIENKLKRETYFAIKVENDDYRKPLKLLVEWVKNYEKLDNIEEPRLIRKKSKFYSYDYGEVWGDIQ